MLRYHKEVFTRPEHQKQLTILTQKINCKNWRFSPHALDNIKHRAIDIEAVLLFIKKLTLDDKNIFEFYVNEDGIFEKICFRIPYLSELDIILVIDINKTIITIYLNSKDDIHYTLKKELYNKG